MEVLLNTPDTRAIFFDKGTDVIALSFTSLLGDDFDPEDDEQHFMDFKPLASIYSTIYITDKAMSWGNHVNWQKLSESISPYLNNKTVIAIGLSMGAFNAIIGSKFIKIDKVIAFCPQYTIYPKIFPKTSYIEWSKRIRQWRFPTVDEGFTEGTAYIVAVGSTDIADTMFLDKFSPHCTILNFGDKYGHNVPKDLKDRGVLYDFIKLAVDGSIQELEDFKDFYASVDV
jgi:hypothetical protein